MKKYFKFFLMAVGVIFAFLSLIVEGLGMVTISSVVICFFLLLIFFQCNYVKWFVNSLLIAVLCLFPFVWMLRDGLGPGSIESKGTVALYKTFMTFYWGPLTVILLIASFITHFYFSEDSER